MSTPRYQVVAAAMLMLAFVFVVNGALPGMLTPTLAQAFWAIGFSQSFINSGFSIYAHNMGVPEPAAMAFGLAGALPASAFLKLGLSAADAYAASFTLWLTVAFAGAYRFTRRLGGETFVSLMSATVWCTMPVIWQHHGYSMLALGIALLPFYFYEFSSPPRQSCKYLEFYSVPDFLHHCSLHGRLHIRDVRCSDGLCFPVFHHSKPKQ